MSLALHYLQTAAKIIADYKGDIPFAPVLKQFFAGNKKYGSRDRKVIGNLCYSYFRLGKALPELAIEERLLVALFYCSTQSNPLLQQLKPEWNALTSASLKEKEALTGHTLEAGSIFPWISSLNKGINKDSFELSHLQQPDLFLRIRPKQHNGVKEKLTAAGLSFQLDGDTVTLPNASKVEDLLAINKQVVIQDSSSQQTGRIALPYLKTSGTKHQITDITFWDCCAASGGKSIMMQDLLPTLQITVSDIRASILHNLSKRFSEAGIKSYQSFVADIANDISSVKPPKKGWQIILADVPCTGSGTWARTPEQLYFFTENKIAEYANKQLSIAENAVRFLQEGGFFIYITCSVFRQENDEVVEQLLSKYPSLHLLHSQPIDGSQQKADSMFIAILSKKTA